MLSAAPRRRPGGAKTAVDRQRHSREAFRTLAETAALFVLMCAAAILLSREAPSALTLATTAGVVLAQSLLFQRMYIIGHETAHRKLVPHHLGLNDTVGQLAMLPILIPVAVYRKVHDFHHGFNRKDHHTSALDVFVTRWRITGLVRAYYHLLWYLGVFAGGFFLHSLASVIVFLFVPVRHAERLSPAFRTWRPRDRLLAWVQLTAGVAFHVGFSLVFGPAAWALALGLPLLAFAWLWSVLMYIFHYHTSIGPSSRHNVRALAQHWFWSWLMMNFHEHATHHMFPNRPWYELPERRAELPAAYHALNQDTTSFWHAIVQQWRGPTIVHRDDPHPAPHLFVRWED
ncbi:fatty acid desaturase family protein [Deinococcus hohokamensis]|uniref:Fatty acid desaturase family protein n=1 Tax=Deinococcus hohokamensis TaxID=309883 RepID=A0ABV9I812_9DEIO